MRRLIALALAAFSLSTASGEEVQPVPLAADPKPAADADAGFAVDLYRALKETPGNLFVSPYSVHVALAMTAEGAAGETAAEMAKALRLPAGGLGDSVAALTRAIEPPTVREPGDSRKRREVRAYEVNVANRLWGQKGYAFEADFLRRLGSRYAAGLEPVDFRQTEAARAAINRWVETATRQKIRDLVPAGLPVPLTRLVLANAIYLKAPWSEPFEERHTREKPFTTADGREVQAPTMHRTDHMRHGTAAGVRLLEIPYRGDTLSMLIVLPEAKDGLPAVEGALDPETVRAWWGALGSTKVSLALPKFRFTTSMDLIPALRRLGMSRAFVLGDADFSGITKSEPLFLGAVLHKAFVAVDEEGTVAAAATASMAVGSAMGPVAPPVPFIVDHPFLFAIVHRPTGAVLFLGRVVDPTKG